MTGTGAIGLMAIFAGDLVNMMFLGLLADADVIAAVGYASSILFVSTSIGIGLSIAASALVAPQLGAGRRVMARRLSGSVHLFTLIVGLALSLVVAAAIPALLTALGAKARPYELAVSYLTILVPALAPLALGMTSAAVLRSLGDARGAMYVTLGGAVLNLLLDPIFIFAMGLGIRGAALASVIARLGVMAIGLYGVMRVHDMLGQPRWKTMSRDTRALLGIAVPAVLTNVATPLGNAIVTASISPFGVEAVAGWAIVGRILPVAFGATYALSGSIGPIIGQNLGARAYGRVRRTLTLSLAVMIGFTATAWLVLAILAQPLVAMFHAQGEAAALILLFCRQLAPLFVFLGALFIANASFNTMGRPRLSTALNWARATIGTLPVVWAGAKLAGAAGVLSAFMLSGLPFGLLGVWLAYRQVDEIEAEAQGRSPS